jgi:hypothetical protein
MGEGTRHVSPADGPADGEPGASRRIGREIATLRDEIGDIVGELERRRREVFDVRLQLRRHPVAVAVVAVAAAALLGGAVAVLLRGRRRRQRRSYRARQLQMALSRMIDHPERVGRGELPPREKILAAAGTAAASLLVRRALERAVPRPSRRTREKAQDGEPAAART